MLCCLHTRQSTTIETEKRDPRWEDLSEQIKFNLEADGIGEFQLFCKVQVSKTGKK